MAIVNTNFTKILIPFYFNKDNSGAIINKAIDIKGKAQKLWESYSYSPNHLLNTIENKLTKTPYGIGESFKLNHITRTPLGLPRNNNTELTLISRSSNQVDGIKLTIDAVYCHIFETNIGFIEFDIKVNTIDYDEFLDANYFLSEFKVKDNSLVYEVSLDRDSKEKRNISLKEITLNLLDGLDGIKYFNDNNGFSNKGIIYSYVLLEKYPDGLMQMLFNGANNYKSTYKSPIGHKNTLETFENSHWGVSPNGAINISNLVGDPTTDLFFSLGFLDNLKQQYFVLYLLALHQKYVLLKQMIDTADLVAMEYNSIDDAIAAKNDVDDHMRSRAIYVVRYKFHNVSTQKHINEYFSLLQNGLNIDSLANEMEQSLEGLKLLSGNYYNQYLVLQKAEEEKVRMLNEIKAYNIRFFVTIATQVIGGLSIFKLVVDIIARFNVNELRSIHFLIAGIITFLFVIIMGAQLIEPYKQKKEAKKKAIERGYL